MGYPQEGQHRDCPASVTSKAGSESVMEKAGHTSNGKRTASESSRGRRWSSFDEAKAAVDGLVLELAAKNARWE